MQNSTGSRTEYPESLFSLVSTIGCGFFMKYFLFYLKKVVFFFSLTTTIGKFNMVILESMGIYRERKQKIAIILPQR